MDSFPITPHLCECGCGQETKIGRDTKLPNRYLSGHNAIGRKLSTETRQRLSESRNGEKHPWFSRRHTEESKQKISKGNKGKIISKETRQKISESHKGEKSYNWNGGTSFGDYCPKFNTEFKERVRDFFNRTCFKCNKSEKQNKKKLSVHHVNYEKMSCCNDDIPLFVTLCGSCHNIVHSNKTHWEDVFTKELMDKFNGKCYLPFGV